MFWIILAALVFIGGIVWAIIEKEGFLFGIGVATTLLVVVFGIIICAIGYYCIPADEKYDETQTDICALTDNTGTFFVGRHHADSSIFYSCLTKTDDGGKVTEKINADDAVIFDDEKEQPYIVKIKKRNSNPFVRFFFYTDTTKYEIHIPPESIRYDYNVDLK